MKHLPAPKNLLSSVKTKSLLPPQTLKKKWNSSIVTEKKCVNVAATASTPMNKTYLTAISRKTLPRPTRWLMKHGLLLGNVLDFGCGKCLHINPPKWDNYDPYYRPWPWHKSNYNTIICNYVLCVLPQAERMPVLKEIQRKLKENGLAFISVRNDRPKQGWGVNRRGTYQGRVRKLPLALLYECSDFRTYLLTKETELV
jgi:hypothetical protein